MNCPVCHLNPCECDHWFLHGLRFFVILYIIIAVASMLSCASHYDSEGRGTGIGDKAIQTAIHVVNGQELGRKE